MEAQAQETFSQRTAWTRSLEEPLRSFLRTETGSAAILLTAAVAALIWANAATSSYNHFWATDLSIRVGQAGITQDLRQWVNNGLMTFFFLVVGLEARREFDLGELRERRRLFLPLMGALGGMVIPVGIFLAFNAGTATALGVIALLVLVRARRVRNGVVYAALGLVGWVALLKSGVDPVIMGVIIGLMAIAYPASRADLERATDLFRLF